MSKIKLLIVDDEVNIAKTIAATFASDEFECQSCYDGLVAWQQIAHNTWDVVFLDLRLPGLDGMEILKRIYENNISSDIVIMTAHGTVDNAVQAMKYGAVDFISKPLEPSSLRDVVTLILKRRNLTETQALEFEGFLELTKQHIKERQYHKARSIIKKAIELKPHSAVAYNLLGALDEVLDDKSSAVQAYQMALSFDTQYLPAKENLQRLTSMESTTISILDYLSSKTRDVK
jgi:DNA-binding response OmpR family regulator